MSAQEKQGAEDFVLVATCATPTQAYLLRGVLEAGGLNPSVVDANIVQANMFLAHAVGGVRVLVPAWQVPAARQAITEFEAGAYRLEGDEPAEAAPTPELSSPIFSPDFAALLGFALTPVFSAAAQMVNANVLERAAPRRRAGPWAWLVLLVVASGAALAIACQREPDVWVVLRASVSMSPVTIAWYLLVGHQQSRHVLDRYGSQYPRRSLVKPALAVAFAEAALGCMFSALA
jgi:hypothetical protein